MDVAKLSLEALTAGNTEKGETKGGKMRRQGRKEGGRQSKMKLEGRMERSQRKGGRMNKREEEKKEGGMGER